MLITRLEQHIFWCGSYNVLFFPKVLKCLHGGAHHQTLTLDQFNHSMFKTVHAIQHLFQKYEIFHCQGIVFKLVSSVSFNAIQKISNWNATVRGQSWLRNLSQWVWSVPKGFLSVNSLTMKCVVQNSILERRHSINIEL